MSSAEWLAPYDAYAAEAAALVDRLRGMMAEFSKATDGSRYYLVARDIYTANAQLAVAAAYRVAQNVAAWIDSNANRVEDADEFHRCTDAIKKAAMVVADHSTFKEFFERWPNPTPPDNCDHSDWFLLKAMLVHSHRMSFAIHTEAELREVVLGCERLKQLMDKEREEMAGYSARPVSPY